jgi:hypothetical protein
VEKVDIVLFQQIAGPVAVPAPAPAPAPQLAQQIVGLPVTSLPGIVPAQPLVSEESTHFRSDVPKGAYHFTIWLKVVGSP